DLRNLAQAGVKAAREFTPAEIAAIGEEICRGLSYVHNLRDENGEHLAIVHRDISPHNIMVSRAGQAKIMDFGIAKAAMRAVKTRTGTIKGKLAYMSPEQASAETVDKRTDQFAVGLVLWELLTGVRHFEGRSEPELLGQVMRCAIRDPRELRADAPEELVHIVGRMLEKAPGDRYPDLADAEKALEAFRFSLGAHGAVRLSGLVETLAKPMDLRPDGSASGAGVAARQSREASKDSATKVLGGAQTSGSLPEDWGDNELPTLATQSYAEAASNNSVTVEPSGLRPGAKNPSRWLWLGLASIAVVALAAFGFGNLGPQQRSVEQVEKSASAPLGASGVRIESSPAGAQLWLDGKETGLTTPVDLMELNVGEQLQVELRLTGYLPRSETVTVANEPQTVRVELLPEVEDEPEATIATRGTLFVTSTPQGAELLVDGKPAGSKTPTQLDLAIGTQLALSLRRKGYEEWDEVLTLEEAERKVHARLIRSRSVSRSKPRSEKSKSSKSSKPPAVATGQVSIRTDGPWVQVFHRGRRIGNTPLNRHSLPAGEVTLKLRRPEETGFFKTLNVVVPIDGHVGKTVVTRK
ncbi:MAG: serine/threonine-protein kinase, partial [Myxococcota bacterium]